MKWLLLLAGLALALCSPAPSIANSWVRNPADEDAALAKGLWTIRDGGPVDGIYKATIISSPYAYSRSGASARIVTRCGSYLLYVAVKPKEWSSPPVWFGRSSTVRAYIDNKPLRLGVYHESFTNTFLILERQSHLLFPAILKELPVGMLVSFYGEPGSELFEWDMKGSAAAWKEACP